MREHLVGAQFLLGCELLLREEQKVVLGDCISQASLSRRRSRPRQIDALNAHAKVGMQRHEGNLIHPVAAARRGAPGMWRPARATARKRASGGARSSEHRNARGHLRRYHSRQVRRGEVRRCCDERGRGSDCPGAQPREYLYNAMGRPCQGGRCRAARPRAAAPRKGAPREGGHVTPRARQPGRIYLSNPNQPYLHAPPP
eukprot:scaffold868_cov305-Prasinococcus_capsulatus_cf.AAC.1